MSVLCEVKRAIDVGRHRKAESLPITVVDIIATKDALVNIKEYHKMISDKFQLILSLVCFF